MFKLESNRLKREFKITNGNFYASQILNKYSNMSLVPDGNGSEFIIHLADGREFSAKGLPVTNSSQDDDKLKFVFAECMGVTVTVEYWVHADGNSICKQLTLSQKDDAIIDYAILDNIGIINSKTHFSVDLMEDSEISGVYASLGQPFYIDSLFFGCEFPATENRIVHGAGQIKYYIGKNVENGFKCPIAIMGGGKDNTIFEVRKAFFEYIDFISQNIDIRFQYNGWFDNMRNITEESVLNSFSEVNSELKAHNAPKLNAYVIDDGWQNMKGEFWSFSPKAFPNELEKIAEKCKDFGSSTGLWISPRGGYYKMDKLAKRFQKKGNALYNKSGAEICTGSASYTNKFADFIIDTTKKYDLSYWKLDGFCSSPCLNETHDHMVGGENEMYYVTDLWQNWIDAFSKVRSSCPNLWINMTCYVNVSPWWLQWVNSLWVQNSSDIDFAENYEEQPQVEAEITYRDGRYYDCLCRRSNQIPLKAIYNHEPVYGASAKVEYTNEEFEKFIYWCMVRGQALNELYLSPSIMNDYKWESLARAMQIQKENYHILKNATFIGGDPVDNNIYGYISWTDDGEGIIALRNPTKDKTSLTLNLNKLMGVPEDLADVKRYNIYNNSMPESNELYSYGSKIDLTMHPFEIMIFKFAK